MSNHYFQFKQFTIRQEHCAMKVCTDACLFGAAVAEAIKENAFENILDIGTGTGLLSLMLAQKTSATIDAVEIDSAAFQQAQNNFDQSPWKERLHLINSDIIHFAPTKKYNCIISNPPFFEGDLKSDQQNKNAAKHDTTLTLEQLLQAADRLLTTDGTFAVLLPFHRVNHCIEKAEARSLFITKKILVKQTENHDFFRGILFFEREKNETATENISIKEAGNYSPQFAALLKDYYLFL